MSAAVELARYHRVLAKRARTFRLAAVVLGAQCRDDAAVLYAFCRAADDAVDDGRAPAEAHGALDALDRGLAGEAGPAVAHAVADLHAARGLSLDAARDLIAGMRRDVGTVRVPDDDALLDYAYLVAGTVGVMMCSVLGVKDARAARHAAELGMAMQITNICRDVAEDAERGRVYLPASRLAVAGLTAQQILDGSAPRPALRQVIAALLERADASYRSAEAGLRFLPPRARLAVLLASRLYRGIGVELLRRGADPFLGRTVVPVRYKAWWLVAAFAAWVRIGLGLARTFHSAEAGRGRAG